MSNILIWQTSTATAEETELLAERIGRALRGGEVIELVSDLGGGKTTFVRGLARGAGSSDHVASPTFTISRVYRAGQRTLRHYDFYRLPEPGLMAAELSESVDDPESIVIVEWGEIVRDVLPVSRLRVSFGQAQDGRLITLQAPPELGYLIDAGRS